MNRPTIRHHLAERELRSLNMDEFLALLREDIRELDALIAARPPAPKSPPPEKKGRNRRTAKEAMDEVMGADDEAPEVVQLHSITCCNHHMGDFPPWARVRCPFCSEWHRAGDFPAVC
jgi:hypothetical protein